VSLGHDAGALLVAVPCYASQQERIARVLAGAATPPLDLSIGKRLDASRHLLDTLWR
jgi:hypothetical protein